MCSLNDFYNKAEAPCKEPHIKIVPFPSEMGSGRSVSARSRSGFVYLDWECVFYDDYRGGGVDPDDRILFIVCLGDGMDWSGKKAGCSVKLKKNTVWIYRGSGLFEDVRYEKGRLYNFKALKIPCECIVRLLSDYFSPEEKAELLNIFFDSYTLLSLSPRCKKIFSALSELVLNNASLKGSSALSFEAETYEFLSDIFQELLRPDEEFKSLSEKTSSVNASDVSPFPALKLTSADIAALVEAKNFIDRDPSFSLTCEALSKRAGMNASKFTRAFSFLFGVSVRRYIIKKRMEKASVLLGEGLNVSETAALLGYNNISHFSDAFKKYSGVLPKEYKSRQLAGRVFNP